MSGIAVARQPEYAVREKVDNPIVKSWVESQYWAIGFNEDGSFIGKRAFKKKLLEQASGVFASTNDVWSIGLYANQIIRKMRLVAEANTSQASAWVTKRELQTDAAPLYHEVGSDIKYRPQTYLPSQTDSRSGSFSISTSSTFSETQFTPPLPYKPTEAFNCRSLYEALPTLDEPPPADYDLLPQDQGTPLPAYGAIVANDCISPPYQYGFSAPQQYEPLVYYPPQSMYPPAPSYGTPAPTYGSLYSTYGLSLAYSQPPVYMPNTGYAPPHMYSQSPAYAQPVYGYPPNFSPVSYGCPPSYGFTAPAYNNQIQKPYHEYGDCGETLPLPTMVNASKLVGQGEIRSLAVFTSVFRGMSSISKDGPIPGIRLKDPCLNCKSLMQATPENISILSGTGSGFALDWTVETKDGSVSNVQKQEPGVGHGRFPVVYNPMLFAAYSATRQEIYHILEAWTVRNTDPSLSAVQKRALTNLWLEFVIPFRDRNQIFRLDSGDNVEPSKQLINGVEIPICTIFCALSYIFSIVLRPERSEFQRDRFYLPLIAVLGKWCYTLCPWAHPNVINVAYSTAHISSSTGIDTDFLIGTSKPSVQAGFQPDLVKSKHQGQMRTWRRIFLEEQYGTLQHPCPVKLAGISIAGINGPLSHLQQRQSSYI